MADDEEAVMLACTSLVFCALHGFASISGTTSGKREVDMSTPVNAGATPLNTCRASRACRDERVAPCCPISATRRVKSRHDFSLCQNAWVRYSVSCRDVTCRAKWNFGYSNTRYTLSLFSLANCANIRRHIIRTLRSQKKLVDRSATCLVIFSHWIYSRRPTWYPHRSILLYLYLLHASHA